MRIGIDRDDTLLDLVLLLKDFHNARYGTKLREEDFFTYSFWEVWGGTPEEAVNKVNTFLESEWHVRMMPAKGAVEVVQEMRKRHKLFVVTSVHEKFKGITEKLIEMHFPGAFSGIHFAYNLYTNHGEDTPTKAQICRRLGLDALFEDSLEYAVSCSKDVKHIFLFDKRWNQGKIPDNCVRGYSWNDVPRYLRSIER